MSWLAWLWRPKPSTADAIVYRDGDQAVAVDRWGRLIEASTDHAGVIQAAIDYLDGGGVLAVIADKLVFEGPVTVDKDGIRIVGNGTEISNPIPTDIRWNHKGHFVLQASNIELGGFKFKLVGTQEATDPSAISIYGGDNIEISNIEVYEDSDNPSGAFGGAILLDGERGVSPMRNVRIHDSYFHDLTVMNKVFNIYPRYGRVVEGVSITRNKFKDVFGVAVFLNAYDYLRRVRVIDNEFIDIIGSSTTYASMVRGASTYIEDVIIRGNLYYNTRSNQKLMAIEAKKGYNWIIEDNILIATGSGTNGPCFAPGDTSYPIRRLIIRNNIVVSDWANGIGFNAFWDPDSMQHVLVEGNIIYGAPFITTGYGEFYDVRIRGNLVINSAHSGMPYAIFTGVPLSGYGKQVVIEDNTIIDDRDSPYLTTFIRLSGGFDFSDYIVRNNRVYVPNGSVSFESYQDGTEVPPKYIDIIIEDINGKKYTRSGGKAVFSGDGSTTQFSIAHGLVSAPSKVVVTPCSADASGSFYVTADDTYIYVNYSSAPPSGTDNVCLHWHAEV